MVAWLDTFEPQSAPWRRWQDAESVLAGRSFREVRCVLLDHDVASEHKDDLLAALIRQAREVGGDHARVATIACLLPGARRVAGRFANTLGWHDAIAEVVASLWEQLDRFDLDRRSDRIASRLLVGAAHRLSRLARRERAWRKRTVGEVDIDALSESAPIAEMTTIASAVRAGVLDTLDATLIEATRLSGLSLVDAASLLGMNYEAAKKRRRRAEASWLAWWAPDRRPLAPGLPSESMASVIAPGTT